MLLVPCWLCCALAAAWSAQEPVTRKHDDPPGAITKTADLRFGEVFTVNAANDVTLNIDGTRAASVLGTLGDGTGVSAASFLLTGNAGASFHLFLPSKLTLSSNTDTLRVKKFTSNLSANHGVLGSDGRLTITVGATLQIDRAQPPGLYTGILEVNVNFE